MCAVMRTVICAVMCDIMCAVMCAVMGPVMCAVTKRVTDTQTEQAQKQRDPERDKIDRERYTNTRRHRHSEGQTQGGTDTAAVQHGLPSCSHDALADESELFPLPGCPDQPDSGGKHGGIDATLALVHHVLNH